MCLTFGSSLVTFSQQPPPGLPEGKYVHLKQSDYDKIHRWVQNKLGSTAIRGQRDNITTNRCESSHNTILKGNPKNRNHRRNFAGRADSGVHSISLGSVDSVVNANAILGVNNVPDCPANSTRRQLKLKESFHKTRKRSSSYRKAKNVAKIRARRTRQSKTYHTGYSTGVQHPVVRHDHRYDDRPTKKQK